MTRPAKQIAASEEERLQLERLLNSSACVDEKPNIQALERGGGYVTSSDRRTIQGDEWFLAVSSG